MLRVLGGLLLLVSLGVAGTWLARKPIADTALRNALESRSVRASYTVRNIGLQWQRIENLRIGDPKSPDLTVDWAEVRVSTGFGSFAIAEIRAGGIRLRGRIVDGRLSVGDVDKLLPKTDGKTPFSLPDLVVDVADARMRIDSPWGQVGGRLDGKGNLANGFAGKLAAIAPALAMSGCDVSRATAYVDVSVRNRAATLNGPIRADAALCSGVAVAKPAVAMNVTLNSALDRWRGSAAVEARGVRWADTTLASITGQISFEGNAADTKGSADLAAEAGRAGTTRLAAIDARGTFSTGRGFSGAGRIEVARLIADAGFVADIDRAARIADGTPLEPMLLQIAVSTRGAAAGLRIISDVSFGSGNAIISDLRAIGANGAVLRIRGGEGIRFGSAGFVADTTINLSGGGFPTVASTLQRRPDGITIGTAQIDPFVGGGARVAFDRIRFAANPSGAMRFETVALLDGPLSGGRVEGLRVPVNATVAANGGVVVNNGCTPLAFRLLSIAGLTLDPTLLNVCPVSGSALVRVAGGAVKGGAVINAPRLSGQLGGTPVNMSASKARVVLGANGFAVDRLSARLGTADRLSLLEIGSLNGRILNGGFLGRFGGTSGKIGNVPLLIDNGEGTWTFRDGALVLSGALRVSDELVPGRFNPLMTEDAKLRLFDSRIDATATLRSISTKTEVSKVVITHNLDAGTGSAVLDVANVRFGRNLQPEELTRLTLGVIANVEGAVSGRGDIRWTRKGVSSTGRFKTDNLDFAAAFGPVTGLKGEIIFDDLLAMGTPPGQQVSIASVNPGTLVTNGVISYRLLPEQRIAVENGAWPFAGGELLLDPTTIDMGLDRDRKLTFRVVGLDAAKFIQQLEFENLAATGIFDGVMPMYFDANGGRIEGGRLVVRRGGGTLAYVGEISNADMNVYAKLAFDALKSIRYNNLTIALNGALDGEIISQINFDGINEAPLSPPKSFIARQFIGLPFVFNIKVTAPFRSLLNTARTFQDPSSLLQRTLPEIRKPPVQPPESEKKP